MGVKVFNDSSSIKTEVIYFLRSHNDINKCHWDIAEYTTEIIGKASGRVHQ